MHDAANDTTRVSVWSRKTGRGILVKILITGGAGMVGSHTAEFYAKDKNEIIVFDNLMRSKLFGYDKKSVEYNWNYLAKYKNIKRILGDIRNSSDLKKVLTKDVDVVVHTAGQPGVAFSIENPEEDHHINAFGTFNVLEHMRKICPKAAFIYCSTNKVYGENVSELPLTVTDMRYSFKDIKGIDETFNMDLTSHTPYGVSKYTGDIYVQEYGHTYGFKTGVFRMSCLARDTEISTPEGSFKIGEIKNKKVSLHSFDNALILNVKRTKGSFRTSGKGKRLYKIQTKGNYSIKATDDHRFFTPLGYRKLKDIAYGSLVAICPQSYYQKNRQVDNLSKRIILDEKIFMKQLSKYRRTSKSNTKYVKNLVKNALLPLSYNNKNIYLISRFVGYLTGDAHLYHRIKKNGKSYTEIQVYALKEEIESIREGFKILGFLPGKVRVSYSRSKIFTGHIIKGVSHKFSLTTTEAFAFFELLGVPVGNKTKLKFEVPSWIKNGPRDVKREYLKGLFGAELSAPSFFSRSGNVKSELQPLQFSQSKNHELSKNAKKFRTQIVQILSEDGVQTRIHETKFFYKKGKDKSVCYYIIIKSSRENFTKFAKIGYGFNKERNIKLYRIIEFMKTGLQYRYYDTWERQYAYGLGKTELLWDSIVHKEEIPMEEIYDITVPINHNFLANGLLVHNCTYGTRQFGFEDQGWLAHFIISNLTDKPITIYGDGKQVRDVLYVEDLVRAFDLFIKSDLKTEVFNIGGGPDNTISLLEFIEMIEQKTGNKMKIGFDKWRPSDQKVYISSIDKIEKVLGWKPSVTLDKGIDYLIEWILANKTFFK